MPEKNPPPPHQVEMELVHFKMEDGEFELNLDVSKETVWATQRQIGELFGRDSDTIGEHIQAIYAEGELLPQATTGKFPVVRIEGKREVTREVTHYNLDMILSVGYRVSSARATKFRQLATGILRSYLTDGFALNEARLKDDPKALRDLAARVRKLRSEEQNIYRGVRDAFAFGSIDYNAVSPQARSFFAKLQDKFLVAITGLQAAEIILDRADHRKRNMGLQAMSGQRPNQQDIQTGKNYLFEDELYLLHILCEQFLLFVESRALRGRSLTMTDMANKFDELLVVQGHPVFKEYKAYLVERARNHAIRELELYRDRMNALPKEQRDSAPVEIVPPERSK